MNVVKDVVKDAGWPGCWTDTNETSEDIKRDVLAAIKTLSKKPRPPMSEAQRRASRENWFLKQLAGASASLRGIAHEVIRDQQAGKRFAGFTPGTISDLKNAAERIDRVFKRIRCAQEERAFFRGGKARTQRKSRAKPKERFAVAGMPSGTQLVIQSNMLFQVGNRVTLDDARVGTVMCVQNGLVTVRID